MSYLSTIKNWFNGTASSGTTIGTTTTSTGTTLTVSPSTGITTISSGTTLLAGNNYTYSTGTITFDNSKQISKLKRKLWRVQYYKRWTHEMDEQMFKSVCGMLDSALSTDNEVGKEIVFNSKMCLKYRKHFAENYLDKLEYDGFERVRITSTGGFWASGITGSSMYINSSGNVGIGTSTWTTSKKTKAKKAAY